MSKSIPVFFKTAYLIYSFKIENSSIEKEFTKKNILMLHFFWVYIFHNLSKIVKLTDKIWPKFWGASQNKWEKAEKHRCVVLWPRLAKFWQLCFKAKRLKLCMQPLLMRALVLDHVRPASEASEAISWNVLFGVSKHHGKKHCERSELRLHFEMTKGNQKCQKMVNLASFWKT